MLEGPSHVLPRAPRMPPLAPRCCCLLALVALLLLALGELSVLPSARGVVEYPQEIPADPPKIPALGCSSEDPRGRGRPPRIPAENVPHNIPKWTVFPELARCSS